VSIYVAYLFSISIYNVYFHPLRKFAGPKLGAATDLYAAYYIVRGQRSKFAVRLHARYGPVVRTRPNELSFIDENAWKDIYAHRQGHRQMQKAGRTVDGKAYSIINAPDDVHARQRRLLSHAFSERAVNMANI